MLKELKKIMAMAQEVIAEVNENGRIYHHDMPHQWDVVGDTDIITGLEPAPPKFKKDYRGHWLIVMPSGEEILIVKNPDPDKIKGFLEFAKEVTNDR